MHLISHNDSNPDPGSPPTTTQVHHKLLSLPPLFGIAGQPQPASRAAWYVAPAYECSIRNPKPRCVHRGGCGDTAGYSEGGESGDRPGNVRGLVNSVTRSRGVIRH